MKILHIDSSILGDESVSRIISADIVARLGSGHYDLEVVYRDLVDDAPLHLTGRHLAAAKGALVPDAALAADLALGSAYMDELFAAEIIVIGAPMYNFTIPSQLKAWIDRVVVAGRTFSYGKEGVQGLVKGKKLYLACSRGGFYLGDSPMATLEHEESYLLSMLGFIGLTDVTVIRAEGGNLGEEVKVAELAKAKAAITALAA